MKTLLLASFVALSLLPAAALADDAAKPAPPAEQQQQQGCGVSSGALSTPGQVTIDCVGVSDAYAGQLAGILTYVLQRRLDPEIVIAKLDEIEGAPPGDQARNLTNDQGQKLVQALVAGKPDSIKIVADPDSDEPGNYALAIATRLGMAGWNIEGNQIPRAVPPGMEDIHGIVLVVHDEKKLPEKAQELKKALGAAKIFVPVVSRPDIAPDGAMLWIGKRPVLDAAATQ